MTLWNWKRQGKIQFHKIGSMNFVDFDTYNKFLCIQEKKEEKVIKLISGLQNMVMI